MTTVYGYLTNDENANISDADLFVPYHGCEFVIKSPMSKKMIDSKSLFFDENTNSLLPIHFEEDSFRWNGIMKDLMSEVSQTASKWKSFRDAQVLSVSPTSSECEALLALPVFKQESLETGFQYILCAATSPATKMNEETVTYLNQGQSYNIKLKKFGELTELRGRRFRSIIRVLFHERRLQFTEREQLDNWKITRPGERIVDVDIPLSYNIYDLAIDANHLNSVEFTWEPTKETGIFIKVHCISTEFTTKRHGGEKGVPFRVQLETYLDDDDEDTRLLHGACCQIKVFKPKGADRKHKTDREKMEKRSPVEKEKYQPSYDCTVMNEIPLDQLHNYLEQKQQQDIETTINLLGASPTQSSSPVAIPYNNLNHSGNSNRSPSGSPSTPLNDVNPASPQQIFLRNIQCISGGLNNSNNDNGVKIVKMENLNSAFNSTLLPTPASPAQVINSGLEPLDPDASSCEVQAWLTQNRFTNYTKVFSSFSGGDLLRLTRDDLIQICGLADGIRLNNAIQSKTVRPKLTLYVCQRSGSKPPCNTAVTTSHISNNSPPNAIFAVSVPNTQNSASGSPPHSSQKTLNNDNSKNYFSYDTQKNVLACLTKLSNNNKRKEQQENQNNERKSLLDGLNNMNINSLKSNDPKNNLAGVMNDKDSFWQQLWAELLAGNAFPDLNLLNNAQSGMKMQDKNPAKVCNSQVLNNSSSQANVCTSYNRSHSSPLNGVFKRQLVDDIDNSDCDATATSNKKQRVRTLELPGKDVYHAIYLDSLTVDDLTKKIAQLLGAHPSCIIQVQVEGPSGIHILGTDAMVQNMKDLTRYAVEAIPVEVPPDRYTLVMKAL